MSRQEPDTRELIGRNIAAAMDEAEITSAELARRLATHERGVRRWRNGEVAPTLDNLARLAREFGKDIAWFYTEHDEKPVAA
jgi:transcriptional regulator with XRE-family HTH domain